MEFEAIEQFPLTEKRERVSSTVVELCPPKFFTAISILNT